MSDAPFRWAVAGLVVAGMAVAVWFRGRAAGSYIRHSHLEPGISSRDEGPVVRVALREDHELVTSGPYAWVRRPLYLGGSVWIFGMVLLSESVLILGAAVVTAVVLALRTRKEERKLEERFGDAWRDHARRTGRFLPGLRRRD